MAALRVRVTTMHGFRGLGVVELVSPWLGSPPVLQHLAKLLRAAALQGARRHCFVKRTMVGTSVAVVTIGASVALPAASATADQIGTTKGQLAALEGQAAAGAAQIHRLTLAYQQANLTVANLDQQISADQGQVTHLQGQVSGSVSMLRREAILSYTGAASNSPVVAKGTTDPSVGAEYLQVATGDVNDNVDQYRTQQRQLNSAEGLLGSQERAGQAAAAAANSARQQLLGEAEAEQAQINRLQQQLSQEIELAAIAAARQRAQAAAQAARATAQANAQAAARAEAQANAQAAAQEAASRRAQPTATQGLPVNNGLVNVVRAIVAAPAPAPVVTAASAPRSPPVTAPPPPPPPAPAPSSGGYTPLGGVWLELRECESSDNYATNTGNGFYGAYQFTLQTWAGLGYAGLPSQASPQTQDGAAVRLQAEAGWGQWPACSAALGLR